MSKKKRVDLGDEKHVKERKTEVELKREREVEELRVILSTYGGRAFVWRLLCRCGIYEPPVTHPRDTFRQVGQKDIGLWMREEVLTSHSKAYTVMQREADDRDLGEG